MEIELKVTLENTEPLLTFLSEKGTFLYEDHQRDDYYIPAHRDFLKTKPITEWLRLRDSNGTYYITYKKRHWNPDGTSNHADELETEIKDFAAMEKIFGVLDFKKIISVEKLRKAWANEDYEISLDTVEGLGDFVEIEYKGKDNPDPNSTIDQMMAFLQGLGCGEIERSRKGYPWLMLEKEGLI